MRDQNYDDSEVKGMSTDPKSIEATKWGKDITDLYESDSKESAIPEIKQADKAEPTIQVKVPNLPTKQRKEATNWIRDFTPKQIEDELQYEMKDNDALTYQELHEKFKIPFAYNEFKASPEDLKKLLIFVKLKKLKDPSLSKNTTPSQEEIDESKREENKKKLSTATMPKPTQQEIDNYNASKAEKKSQEGYKKAVDEDRAARDLYKAKQPTREASQKVIDEIKANKDKQEEWSITDLFD